MSRQDDAAEGRLPFAQRLIVIYARAAVRIGQVAQTALGSRRLGEPRYRRDRMAEVREVLQALRGEAKPLTGEVVREAFEVGAENVQGIVPSAELLGRDNFGAVNRNAVNTLADGLFGRLDGAAVTVGRGVEDVFRREGLRQAARQLLAELPEPSAVKALQEQLRRSGAPPFVDRSGRRWDLEVYARMVVRTTAAEAVAQGTANRMLARGFDLVEIVGDQHPGDECSEYLGKTFSLTGATDGFARLDRLPPFHPNCGHRLKPSPLAAQARRGEL